MTTLTIILIPIAVVILAVAGLSFLAINRWRTKKLREKFGPEYDYTVEKAGDRRAAEQSLHEREKRVDQLEIHSLDANERDRYHAKWMEILSSFIEDPSTTVEKGSQLISEVMAARGFPLAALDQREADLSVIYPDLIAKYRAANIIALKNQLHECSTEELRQAMVFYQALFEVLLGDNDFFEPENKEQELIVQ